MNWEVDSGSTVPSSQQLVAAVLDAVGLGELNSDDRLPSVRAMAGMALVNPNTVIKAYRDLERMGVTQGRNGSGVFVTEAGPELARTVRQAETATALAEAVRMALRSGHYGEHVQALVAAAIEMDECPAAPASNGEGKTT